MASRRTEWPFEDIIDFQEGPGILAKDFRESGIPLVRLAGLERQARSVLEGCNYLDPATVEKRWSHFVLRSGDILLSTSASLGRIAVVANDAVGAIAYTGIIRMRPRDDRVHAPFIRYLLEGPDFQQQAEMVGVGSVIRHFGPMHLRQMSLEIPPPDQQRAIAAFLGALDQKIELNRRMSETLEALARAIFQSWFVDFDPVRAKAEGRQPAAMDAETASLFPDAFEASSLGPIPAGWRIGDLSAFATVTYGYPFASSLFSKSDGVPLVRIRDLSTQNPEVGTRELATRDVTVTPGDVVVGMDGEFRTHHWAGEPALLNQRLARIRPAAGVSKVFVRQVVRDPLADAERSKTGTTVIHLGKADIDRFRFVIAPQTVHAAFGRLAEPLLDRYLLNAAENRTLSALRDLLLPKLISGERRLAP